MSDERVTPLLSLPFNSFLMLRLEYVLLTGNDLQALLLRLIEKRMEDQRRRLSQERLNALKGTVPPEVVLDIPTDVWAPISHASFLYDLYGLVQSENTLKKALQELCKRKLIFKRKGQGRYAPEEYQLNLKLLQEEFQRMQQQGKAGYHPLTPSEVETFMASSEGQKLIPSEGQKLIPCKTVRGSKVDPMRGSEVDPSNRKRREERFREEAVAEESEACRFESTTPSAAAAGLSERESFSSPHSCPHDESASASGQSLTPAREPDREKPIQAASGTRTARSAPVPVSQEPQQPGHALPGAGESSPGIDGRPAGSGSTPTSAPPQHPVPPALFGAQAQAAAAPAPAKDEPLSPEAMVALVERLLGVGYDAAARARQLQAARQLLAMKLLPDLATLSRLYALCYDDWWRQHYGLLHLTHLVERETSGQPRILRLLARLTPAPASPSAPSSVSFAGRAAVGSQSRQSGEEANAWLKRNQRDSLEKLLRNGDQLVAKMRASGDREAERFAACLQFLKQQQAQQQAQGGMPCND